MTVPTGTTGASLTPGTLSGIGAGTAVLATNMVTFTVTSPTSIPGGTAIAIPISGFTNTATIGRYTSAVTTHSVTAPVDSAITTPSVTIATKALLTATWTATNQKTSTASVSYTYGFKTATAGTVKTVTMSVPPGTSGTPALGTITTISTGTLALAGNSLTFTVTTPAAIAKTKTISIQVTGLTNTSLPGSYTAQITTNTTTTPIDSGISGAVAFTGTLVTPTWAVSSHTKGATAVIYTYGFTTGSAGVIRTVTMVVPSGTAGASLGVGTVSGIGAGTVALASTTLTYTVTSPISVPAGTTISIPITGVTNSGTAKSSTAAITTKSSVASIDLGTTPPVVIAGALTTPKLTLSNPVTGTTGVTYTYAFKTATVGILKTITVTVPPGTAGTPTNTVHTGLNAGTTSAISSNTITYSVTTAISVPSGTSVTLTFTGLTNTTVSGSYTATITTSTATTPVDTGATSAVPVTPPLTSPLWSTSSTVKGAGAVTYTYSFTTQATATVGSVTMTVPAGTSKGTLGVGTLTGIGAGTATLATNTLTYTVTSPASIPAGTAVTIPITGIINTSTAGSYPSTITTKSSTGILDTGTTPSVPITSGSLTNRYWGTSSAATSASGTSYTYGFTLATSGNVSSVTMRIPAGTTGTPTVGTVSAWQPSKVTLGSQSVTRSGTTLIFSFSSIFMPSGTVVSITINGLNNTPTSGNYTSTITTFTSTTPVDTGVAAPVALTSPALSGPFWTPSSTKTSTTGVTYAYGFTATTTATLSSVVMTVPPGTTGTPTVGTVSPAAVSGGHAGLSGQVLTYTLASATSVAAGTTVFIQLTGLRNTATAGVYSEQIVTKNATSSVNAGALAPRPFTTTALKTLSWSASSTKTGGTASAYTFDFTTNTAQWLKTITMSVPPGTSGTPAVGTISAQVGFAITMKTPTVSLSGTTLSFSFTGVFFQANTVVSIQITGLTNTTTAGAYPSSIVTFADPAHASSIRPPVDSGTAAAVNFSSTTLTSLSWSASSTQTGATGVSYTFSFGVSLSSTISSVSMSVPPGTSGTPLRGTVTPPAIAGGTVSLATTVLTYTFPTATISPSTTLSITVTGLTNTPTLNVYASLVTAKDAGVVVASGTTSPISFTSSVLTSLSWSASSTTAGATGVSYTWGFTTATGHTLSSVTMSVPSGTAGTPHVGTVSVFTPGTGTITLSATSVSLSVNTVTFSFTARFIAAASVFSLQMTGFTNTTAAGSYTSSVTTKSATTAIDSGTTPALSLSSGALTGATWTVSSTAINATPVTYTYHFTVPATVTINTLTLTVPHGTTGSPLIGTVSPSSLTHGAHLSLSGTLLTYTFTTASVSAGTTVAVAVTAMKNTTAASSASSNITILDSGTAIASGTTSSVTFTATVLHTLSWTVSSTKTGTPGVAYTFGFKTGSAATLTSVTMSVPLGTGGTPAVGAVTPATVAGGTVAFTGTTILKYTFPAAQFVPSARSVSIQITGLTNTSAPASYTSTVATQDSGAGVDSGTTPAVALVGGTLASPTWSASNTSAGTATSYTYAFTTVSTSTLTKVTMSVPHGTGGTPTVGTVTPTTINHGTSVSLVGTTITFSFTAGTVTAGTAVSVRINGLTNTTTTGSYTSTITTYHGATSIDTGTSSAITITAVAPTGLSLTFSNACAGSNSGCVVSGTGATGITLIAIPGAGSAATASVALSVQSNLASGYRVRAQATALVRTGGGAALPEASTSGSASRPTSQFYASASLAGSGSSGAALCTPYGSALPYVGYGTSAASIWNATASTGSGFDVVTVTNAIQVSATQAAGTYTGTIAYTVNPAYTGASAC